MSIIDFWFVTSCGLVGDYQRIGGTYSLYIQREDGSDMFLRNVGNHLQDHTTSQTTSPRYLFALGILNPLTVVLGVTKSHSRPFSSVSENVLM
jgi:hypothetical protein